MNSLTNTETATTKHIEFTERGSKFRNAYQFVEGYLNNNQESIDVDGEALSDILRWTDYDLQNLLPHFAEKKQYSALLYLCEQEFEWNTWISERSLELIKEALIAYPQGYENFVHGQAVRTFRNGLNELLEQLYVYCAPHYGRGVLKYIPEKYKADKKVVLSLVKHFPHFINGVNDCDTDFLKQCVAQNAKVLEYKTADARGKIALMRELVLINPECAKFALSPITTNAGVKKEDGDQQRQVKVLNWLMATGERKDMKKAGVLVAVKATAAADKKVHKI